mmetsp:Transcript_3311/g.10336  ORF Transcript_3311/g.10336 Transcript_3311/m.10336 type:complete len:308 (-) Transcript_3311:1849-2772(-)
MHLFALRQHPRSLQHRPHLVETSLPAAPSLLLSWIPPGNSTTPILMTTTTTIATATALNVNVTLTLTLMSLMSLLTPTMTMNFTAMIMRTVTRIPATNPTTMTMLTLMEFTVLFRVPLTHMPPLSSFRAANRSWLPLLLLLLLLLLLVLLQLRIQFPSLLLLRTPPTTLRPCKRRNSATRMLTRMTRSRPKPMHTHTRTTPHHSVTNTTVDPITDMLTATIMITITDTRTAITTDTLTVITTDTLIAITTDTIMVMLMLTVAVSKAGWICFARGVRSRRAALSCCGATVRHVPSCSTTCCAHSQWCG